MKKFSLFFLICLLTISFTKTNIAQVYYPFPDSNASWRIVQYNYPPGQFPPYLQLFDYIISGDTLINDMQYVKITRNDYDIACSRTILGSYYAGAYRNDIAAKKVYFIPPEENEEVLLYDFSLEPGDTVPLTYNNQLYPELMVWYIDSVYCYNEYRRRIVFDYSAIIEGIGADEGLLEPISGYEPLYGRWCYYQNDTLLLYIDDYSCTISTDTCVSVSIPNNNIYTNILTISPHPVVNISHICIKPLYNDYNNYRIFIYDITGESKMTSSFTSTSITINKNDFGGGIFLYRLYYKDNILQSGKIIIF